MLETVPTPAADLKPPSQVKVNPFRFDKGHRHYFDSIVIVHLPVNTHYL